MQVRKGEKDMKSAGQEFGERGYGKEREDMMNKEIHGDAGKIYDCQEKKSYSEETGGAKQEKSRALSQAIRKDDKMGEADVTEILRMEVESRSRNEEFARVAVAVFMSRLDPTLEEVDDVKTAVSEAVTNAVIHGYQGKEGIIYILVAVKGQELTVEVEDKGVGIEDVPKAMEPMYTTDTSGERSGMGFSFMEAFMDEVEVISALGQGTRVIMKKHIGR